MAPRTRELRAKHVEELTDPPGRTFIQVIGRDPKKGEEWTIWNGLTHAPQVQLVVTREGG